MKFNLVFIVLVSFNFEFGDWRLKKAYLSRLEVFIWIYVILHNANFSKGGKKSLEGMFKNFSLFLTLKTMNIIFIEFICNAPVSVINNKNDANKTMLRESSDNNLTNIKRNISINSLCICSILLCKPIFSEPNAIKGTGPECYRIYYWCRKISYTL